MIFLSTEVAAWICFCETQCIFYNSLQWIALLNTNDAISDETKRPGRVNSGLMKVSGTELFSQQQAFSSLFSPDRSSRGTGGNGWLFLLFLSVWWRGDQKVLKIRLASVRENATGRVACKPHSFVCIVVKCVSNAYGSKL